MVIATGWWGPWHRSLACILAGDLFVSQDCLLLLQVREAEEGASRARATRREDAKRAAKERAQMAERLKVGAGCLLRVSWTAVPAALPFSWSPG